jgi:hypothetical protein
LLLSSRVRSTKETSASNDDDKKVCDEVREDAQYTLYAPTEEQRAIDLHAAVKIRKAVARLHGIVIDDDAGSFVASSVDGTPRWVLSLRDETRCDDEFLSVLGNLPSFDEYKALDRELRALAAGLENGRSILVASRSARSDLDSSAPEVDGNLMVDMNDYGEEIVVNNTLHFASRNEQRLYESGEGGIEEACLKMSMDETQESQHIGKRRTVDVYTATVPQRRDEDDRMTYAERKKVAMGLENSEEAIERKRQLQSARRMLAELQGHIAMLECDVVENVRYLNEEGVQIANTSSSAAATTAAPQDTNAFEVEGGDDDDNDTDDDANGGIDARCDYVNVSGTGSPANEDDGDGGDDNDMIFLDSETGKSAEYTPQKRMTPSLLTSPSRRQEVLTAMVSSPLRPIAAVVRAGLNNELLSAFKRKSSQSGLGEEYCDSGAEDEDDGVILG